MPLFLDIFTSIVPIKSEISDVLANFVLYVHKSSDLGLGAFQTCMYRASESALDHAHCGVLEGNPVNDTYHFMALEIQVSFAFLYLFLYTRILMRYLYLEFIFAHAF